MERTRMERQTAEYDYDNANEEYREYLYLSFSRAMFDKDEYGLMIRLCHYWSKINLQLERE